MSSNDVERDTSDSDLLEPSYFNRIIVYVKGLPALGIILSLISGMVFATATLTVKLLPNIEPVEIVVIR